MVPTSTFFFPFNYRYTANPGSKNQFPSHAYLEVLSKPLLFFFSISLPSISCLFQENPFSHHVWSFPSSLFLDCKMKFVRNISKCLDVPRNILKWVKKPMQSLFWTCFRVNSNISLYLSIPCGSAGEKSACSVGDLGSFPGLGRSPGEGKGYPLQFSGLENSMDSPWGHKESDMTEQLSLSLSIPLGWISLIS